jgi:hypothetical protein
MSRRYSFDPQVIDSFYAYGDRFCAVTTEGTVFNPAHTILDVVLNRVEADAELDLPEGWDETALRQIYGDVTRFGSQTMLDPEQAGVLSHLGHQVLVLNAKGQIQPALDSSIFEQKESKAIGHLIEEVARDNH